MRTLMLEGPPQLKPAAVVGGDLRDSVVPEGAAARGYFGRGQPSPLGEPRPSPATCGAFDAPCGAAAAAAAVAAPTFNTHTFASTANRLLSSVLARHKTSSGLGAPRQAAVAPSSAQTAWRSQPAVTHHDGAGSAHATD